MYVVERSPGGRILLEVPLHESGPHGVALGHAPDIADTPRRMVDGIGCCYLRKFVDHVVHPALALGIAGHLPVHGHGSQVMTCHMAVEACPVGIVLRLFRQTGLSPERGKESVYVVLEKHFQVQVPGMLERAVEKFHVPYRELIVIKTVLGSRREAGPQDNQ